MVGDVGMSSLGHKDQEQPEDDLKEKQFLYEKRLDI